VSALPRPDLAPGPKKSLSDALHDLHHRAGWPSLRTLARDTGVSHTTVSKVMSAPALPSWGTLELLVEAMDGDAAVFHELWLAASTPTDDAPAPAPRIAGRRAELETVRRHLETGTGLLLVTGEAGIGKSALVSAAAATTGAFLATGHCLPLATELPLLAFADVLRAMSRREDGRWFQEALTECPSYVPSALAPLLPELAPDGAPEAADSFARHRMFAAMAALLDILATTHPFAVVLEDLHWADGPSLDLLEHLVAGGLAAPLVGTWRTGDPETGKGHDVWSARIQRQSGVRSMDLEPLTREETAEQLLLATGAPAPDPVVARIHTLGQGLPLYTEHLARAPDDEVPRHLADLLDLRLGQLHDDPWRVAAALGIAERGLTVEVVAGVSGLSDPELHRALKELARRRLVRTGEQDLVTLAHPLLAQGICRRLLPGEAGHVHARLAEHLAAQPFPEPGEVAHHWQLAGRAADELPWRVAAARRAWQRFAARETLDNWMRVLELHDVTDARTDIETWEVLSAAIVAAEDVPDRDVALDLVERSLALDVDDTARVQLLKHAGDMTCWAGDHAAGLALLDEARTLVDRLPPAPELIDVLFTRITNLSMVGDYEEVRADLRRAFALLEQCDDPLRRQEVLSWAAWHAMAEGDHDRASALIAEARESSRLVKNPLADIDLATTATDILLFAAAPATSVDEAAAHAFDMVAEWDLEGHPGALLLRANVAEAHVWEGDVEGAAVALGLDPSAAPSKGTAHVDVTLAAIELRRGHVAAALARCEAADALMPSRGANWAGAVPMHAEAALYAGDLGRAATLLDEAMDLALPSDNARSSASLLTLRARVSADVLDQQQADSPRRLAVVAQLRERHRCSSVDPFGPESLGRQAPTWALQWHAELARVEQRDDMNAWTRVAAAWDGLRRPHDAAYCRWRAAQVAVRDGQGTVAARLLTKAATDAREHVPLSEAIATTRSAAR
jgi:tetratricopeptide (TPR) repeat protein